MDTIQNNSILVIDDTEQNLQLLGRHLIDVGYIVTLASNAIEGFEALECCNYDLVLLDINMPGLDGFDVCQKLKTNPQTKDIPVIFITVHNNPENISKAFKVGGADYIAKPFIKEELLGRIENHLKIKNHNKQLEALNQALEFKVKDRTIELTETNKRLEKYEKAKTDIINMLAHELKTPLNGILSIAKYLETYVKDENILDLLNDLIISAKRLNKYSETALLISNLKLVQTGILFKEHNSHDFYDLIESSIIEHNERIEEKKLNIVKIFPNYDVELRFDNPTIRFAINSIFDNAIRFSKNYGTIEIEAIPNNNYITINISDHGEGFSEDSVDNLFDYFSVGNILNHSEGHGLSLAAVKLIMDLHQGKASAKRVDGKTVFSLIIPIL